MGGAPGRHQAADGGGLQQAEVAEGAVPLPPLLGRGVSGAPGRGRHPGVRGPELGADWGESRGRGGQGGGAQVGAVRGEDQEEDELRQHPPPQQAGAARDVGDTGPVQPSQLARRPAPQSGRAAILHAELFND